MSSWPIEIDEVEPLPILFARPSYGVSPDVLPDPCVLLVPDKTSFNNFGRLFWSEMYVCRDGEMLTLSTMLMFQGEANTKKFLSERLDAIDADLLPAAETGKAFVTLFNEETSYAQLVNFLGFGIAIATLRSLGDAVFLEQTGDEDDRRAMLDTLAFHEGVTRERTTYSSFRRGGRFLTPYPPREAALAPRKLQFETLLPGTKEPLHTKFDFAGDQFVRDRLAVLIGRNGVGKTQLIRSLIAGLLKHRESPALDNVRRAEFLERPDIARVVLLSSVSSDCYPLRIPAWTGLDYEYLALVDQADEGPRKLLSLLLDCTRDPGEQGFFYKGMRRARYDLLKILLHRMGFWEGLAVPLVELEGTESVFGDALSIDGVRYIQVARLNGEQRSIRVVAEADHARSLALLSDDGVRQLSSGETAMLRFAVSTVSAIEPGSLIILEEPETHLHPNYVSELMAQLHDLLEASDSVAIAVTHSAYVVREAPRERVVVLRRRDDNETEFVPTPIQTFGASIDSISQFVFSDGVQAHQYQQTLREWVEAHPDMTIERLKELAAELNPETMAFLVGIVRGDAPFDAGAQGS